MKRIIILGSTGSIGSTALNSLKDLKGIIQITGLSAYSQKGKLLELAKKFSVKNIATPLADEAFIKEANKYSIKVYNNVDSLLKETETDVVLNGIAGAAGLKASITSIKAGKPLALANKESIVMAGPLLKALAKQYKVKIYPVDSEHSCLNELINAHGRKNVEKLFITASGGPFRNYTKNQLKNITPEQASHNPNWKMGKKITIDSATLANKALEVIEASYLFDMEPKNIITIINPTSQVHSLISLKNGQTYAQLSNPSMTFPIMNAIYKALGMKYQMSTPSSIFDSIEKGLKLEFLPMIREKEPMLDLGYRSMDLVGGPIIFNSANEVAVNKFCQGKIQFLDIPILVQKVLKTMGNQEKVNNFETVFKIDTNARAIGEELSKTF